jgi:hypothetical protein
MTSYRAQVGRLRRLAGQAMAAFPVAEPVLTFVVHGENTTFRVDAETDGGPARFLLRVHRPGRHGVDVDPAAAVRSELDWLTAGRAQDGVHVSDLPAHASCPHRGRRSCCPHAIGRYHPCASANRSG